MARTSPACGRVAGVGCVVNAKQIGPWIGLELGGKSVVPDLRKQTSRKTSLWCAKRGLPHH